MRFDANACERIFHHAFYADTVTVTVTVTDTVKEIIKRKIFIFKKIKSKA